MPRDYKISLDDILEAVDRIETYTAGMDKAQFQADRKTIDAVVRNREIIGEAVKKIRPKFEPLLPLSRGRRSPGCETSSFTCISTSIRTLSGTSLRTS